MTNPKDNLKNKQMTIYLSEDLQTWLKDKAAAMTKDTGKFFSVSNVVGQIIADYKESQTSQKILQNNT